MAADAKTEDKITACPEERKGTERILHTFDSNLVHASSDIRFMQVIFEARTFPWEHSKEVLSKALPRTKRTNIIKNT